MQLLEYDFKNEVIRGSLQGNSKRIWIMIHGFTGNKIDHHRNFIKIANLMEAHHYSVLRLDLLGNGESSGDESRYDPILQIEQVEFVLAQLKNDYDEINLFGFSLGGVISSKVAARNEAWIQNLILLSPAGNFKEITQTFLTLSKTIMGGFDYMGYYFSDHLIESFMNFDTFNEIHFFKKRVFLLQGSNDEFVSLDSFQRYIKIYGENVTYKMIANADHCFKGIDQTNELLSELTEILEDLT